MMLALTVREVQSSGSAVTFRLSGNRALTLPRQGKRRGEEEEEKKGKERWRRQCTRGHAGDCSYDAYEGGRQWTTGGESLKGMASAGWQDGRRERGKYATAERDKCGRTNRWWLMGSFIHCCDQIQQDSPPYGMAQLIHPITWTTYKTRGEERMVCVCFCVCAEEKVPEGFLRMTVNERGSEKNKAMRRNVINLLKAQYFWIKGKKKQKKRKKEEMSHRTKSCFIKHGRCTICLEL